MLHTVEPFEPTANTYIIRGTCQIIIFLYISPWLERWKKYQDVPHALVMFTKWRYRPLSAVAVLIGRIIRHVTFGPRRSAHLCRPSWTTRRDNKLTASDQVSMATRTSWVSCYVRCARALLPKTSRRTSESDRHCPTITVDSSGKLTFLICHWSGYYLRQGF